ncbi:MAG: hypothetical protein ACKVON_09540 [Beijerinckiaceae bacterium]
MRQVVIMVALVAAWVGSSASASALDFSQSGNTARISGAVKPGDGAKFDEFMARPGASSIRIFILNSPGGSIGNALEIARRIRRMGAATVVDGKASCESACTVIFAGGSNRHYVNTSGLQDRLGGNRGGLGFHEGNNANADGRGRQYSGQGTAAMINAYYELGVGGAAQFATKAGFNAMYRVSGQTALQNRVATSLSPP